MYPKLVFNAASLQASIMSSSKIVDAELTEAELTIPTRSMDTLITTVPVGPVVTLGK